MKPLRPFAALVFTALAAGAAAAQDQDGSDHVYRVATLRAAPGTLPDMIDALAGLAQDGFYDEARRTAPLIMRHSQGDHWDLMLLEPAGSLPAYFAADRLASEDAASGAHGEALNALTAMTAFEHVFFAYGPAPDAFWAYVDGADLFHIEMFEALHGRLDDLVEQRAMENAYLEATERRANLVFLTEHGSNVDVFTLGAYADLAAFAASPDLPDEAFEQAAADAGFESRSTIGFYLRELMAAHHDTLATSVE